MSTSNSTDFSISRNKIIEGALRLLGATAQGESPTTAQYDEASEALNMMVKAWEADGMPLWAIKQYNISLATPAVSYEIGVGKTVNTAKPLRIIQAFYHNGNSGIDVPMIGLTRTQYNQLGNKSSTGQPIQYYYDVQINSGTLYLYPVPDSTTTSSHVTIVYQRPFEDFDTSTDEPDFPQEWFDAVKFGLAVRLAPEYGISSEQFGILRNQAKEIKDTALGNGTEEGSMFFQIERRYW